MEVSEEITFDSAYGYQDGARRKLKLSRGAYSQYTELLSEAFLLPTFLIADDNAKDSSEIRFSNPVFREILSRWVTVNVQLSTVDDFSDHRKMCEFLAALARSLQNFLDQALEETNEVDGSRQCLRRAIHQAHLIIMGRWLKETPFSSITQLVQCWELMLPDKSKHISIVNLMSDEEVEHLTMLTWNFIQSEKQAAAFHEIYSNVINQQLYKIVD